jgi:hypothetical protein
VRSINLALGLIAITATAGSAQSDQRLALTLASADSAMAAGQLATADSLYYAAVQSKPRDPAAREALGTYLGMRGASRVAAVLLEEARMFGGEPARIAAELSPLYRSLGDWRALLTLPASTMGSSERRRAAWLTDHPTGSFSDASWIAFVGLPHGDTLARVAMRIGDRTVIGSILGTETGVVAGTRAAGEMARMFGDKPPAVSVIDSLSVGSLKMINVPATVDGPADAASIGVTALAPLLPTFDYNQNRVKLERRHVDPAPSRSLPLIRSRGKLLVLRDGQWIPIGVLAESIAGQRGALTIDLRAGEVLIKP